jgi:glycosyltransferase involved in cell wall biosynthesis
MNILVVSSKFPPEYAGSALRAHNTYRRLADRHCVSYEVLTSSVTWNTCQVYEHEGSRVTRIARKIGRRHPGDPGDPGEERARGLLRRLGASAVSRLDYALEAAGVWRFLARKGKTFDAFHVFGNNHVTAAALTYAKAVDKPCLVELVNLADDPFQYEPRLISLLLGGGFPRRSLLVCISPRLAGMCRRSGIGEDNIWVRPNPVDEGRFRFQADREALREEVWPGIGRDHVLLVYVAKFRRLKNQRFLLDVLARLPERHRLILAGPLVETGPLAERQQSYFRELEEAAGAMGLGGRVSLRPGFVDRPETLLKAADVYVMPSTYEALGTPVLEALACGTPCVTNSLEGVFESMVTEARNGFIRELDPFAWAKAIERAAAIPREAMAREAAAVHARAGTEVIDREYVARLRSLAGAP